MILENHSGWYALEMDSLDLSEVNQARFSVALNYVTVSSLELLFRD